MKIRKNTTTIASIGIAMVTLVVTLVAGCSSSSPEIPQQASGHAAVSIVQGQSPDAEAENEMLAAKEALFTKLSARLMEAMMGQGPAAAIAVCQKESIQIADSVSKEHDLRIGRTGVRLRNPGNSAPSWAQPLVDNKTDTPTFVKLDNGDSAALLPIKLQGQCLMCHGPKEQIAPVIQNQLAKLYPDDQATGFKEGELRGWFWIELPGR